MSSLIKTIFAILIFAIVFVASLWMRREPIEDDLTARVRAELATLDITDLDVSFQGQDGLLTGLASTPDAKQVAGEQAAQVWGVRKIVNDITIDSREPAESMEASQTDPGNPADAFPASSEADASRQQPVTGDEPAEVMDTAAEKATLEAELDALLTEQAMEFEWNSATLTPASKATLDLVADQLNAATDLHIEVQGHTDSTGDSDVNMELSEERAAAVMTYLRSKNLPASLTMEAKGYGETQPIATNATREGRRLNRRVVLRIN